MSEITEASMIIVGPRRRGRPRSTESRSSVSAWIATEDHDRLIQLAQQRETSVSSLVRQILSNQLNKNG